MRYTFSKEETLKELEGKTIKSVETDDYWEQVRITTTDDEALIVSTLEQGVQIKWWIE